MSSSSTLLRQRLPFLALLACAIFGIAISEQFDAPSTIWLVVAALAVTAFLVSSRRLAFLIFVVCIFGALHLWQSVESQASRFGAWLGTRSLPAEAHGVVVSEPRVFSAANSSFEVRLSQLRLGTVEIAPSFILQVELPGPPPTYGDEVSLRGTLQTIAAPRNPGQFNFAAWMARRDIFSRMRVEYRSDLQVVRQNQGNLLVAYALRIRAWLRQTLTEGVNDPTVSDLLVAMVLGDVSSLPARVEEEFRGTGVSTFSL